MRARLQIVVFGEAAVPARPQPERAEHPPGNILQLRLFHLLVRPVSQIGPLGVGDRDQLGLILSPRRASGGTPDTPTRRKRWGLPSVHCRRRTSAYRRSGIGHRQRPQQQRVDEPERRGACPDRQRQRQDRRGGSHFLLGAAASRRPRRRAANRATERAGYRGSLRAAAARSRRPSGPPRGRGPARWPPRCATASSSSISRLTHRRELHLRCATTTTYQTVLRTRFTAEVTACQRDSSAASCFLPAAVSS